MFPEKSCLFPGIPLLFRAGISCYKLFGDLMSWGGECHNQGPPAILHINPSNWFKSRQSWLNSCLFLSLLERKRHLFSIVGDLLLHPLADWKEMKHKGEASLLPRSPVQEGRKRVFYQRPESCGVFFP